jgi:hypothetical protein
MAIDAELVAHEGQVQSLPPVFRKAIAAAGSTDIDADCQLLVFRNFSTSQAVQIRLNADADNTQAAANDSKSIKIEAGTDYAFLVGGHDGSQYKLDVR